jgi:hypothetical protein
MSNNTRQTKHKGDYMKVLYKAHYTDGKSVHTTIKLELNLIDHFFYISTTKGRTSVSKLDNFEITADGMVIHDFGDIMANSNAVPPIPNAITRATEKALWDEHDNQLKGIISALIAKYEV